MSISREEATAALDTIESAEARGRTIKIYAASAPFLILWGCIWLVANATTDLAPQLSAQAWMAAMIVGTAATVLLTVRNSLDWRGRFSATESRAIGRRMSLLGVTLMAWFPVLFLITGPLQPRQTNALISLVWAFTYMVAGAFVGWRLFAIGAFTAGAIVFGFFFIQQHFFLWMGVVGGGSLIAGGLWLRKI